MKTSKTGAGSLPSKLATAALSLLFLSFIGVSSISFANDIYIEQSGDNSTIDIVQDGVGNRLGESLTPSFIGGGSNTVTIDQIGSSNQLDFTVNGAATSLVVNTNGSGNIQEVQCGTQASAACSGSVIKQIVTGDDNIVRQLLGSGGGHNSEITIVGDTNTVTHTSTNSGTASAIIGVTGNLNNVSVLQEGTTAKSVTVNSTGNSNNITIRQSN